MRSCGSVQVSATSAHRGTQNGRDHTKHCSLLLELDKWKVNVAASCHRRRDVYTCCGLTSRTNLFGASSLRGLFRSCSFNLSVLPYIIAKCIEKQQNHQISQSTLDYIIPVQCDDPSLDLERLFSLSQAEVSFDAAIGHRLAAHVSLTPSALLKATCPITAEPPPTK